ncbi:homeobox protein Dlx6a-like [Protobothrops mucrosquamatus]|uniref:homeobox protein Dlx6a-like n=1 Tax=Protobothrops mucrosquamatus TaxID=103944 RepID=UPI0010FBBAB3|nr:homeobox protein Dlx6a-like [Protobothrops mucrosquamatus]
MTMTTVADGLDAQDSSKPAFMEFRQQQQQLPPQQLPHSLPPPPVQQQTLPVTAMAGVHYPLHCALHQHPHHHHHHVVPYPANSASANSHNHCSFAAAAYPYMSHSQHSPYLQSYHGGSGSSSAASQTRPDDAGG